MTDIISGIGETMADTDKDTANDIAVEKVEIRSNAEILASNKRIDKIGLLLCHSHIELRLRLSCG